MLPFLTFFRLSFAKRTFSLLKMTEVPRQQQAWMVMRMGLPKDAVELKRIPVPQPRSKQVLVKVEAAAMNPVGSKVMRLVPNFLVGRPRVAEHDLTGTVIDANNSTRFKVGDKVFGFVAGFPQDKQGALAQYVVINEDWLAIRPDNLNVHEAAGLPLVASTSFKSIFEYGQVEDGQHVFVNGGSSSVGLTAIQILKAHGCKVSTSCSAKNIELVKKFGADNVYDYTTSPLHYQLSFKPPSPKFNAIIDAIGTWSLYYHCESYLVPGGRFVAPGSGLRTLGDLPRELYGFWNAFWRPTWLGGVRREFVLSFGNAGQMDTVADLARQGKLTIPVDSVFEWKYVHNAYDRIMSQRAAGKVVVNVPA